MALGFGLAAVIASVFGMMAPLSFNMLLVSAATVFGCVAALAGGRALPIATVLLSFTNLFFMSPLTLLYLGLQGLDTTSGNGPTLGFACLLMASPIVAIIVQALARRSTSLSAIASQVEVVEASPPLQLEPQFAPVPPAPPVAVAPSTEELSSATGLATMHNESSRDNGSVADLKPASVAGVVDTPVVKVFGFGMTALPIGFAFLVGLVCGTIIYHFLRADIERSLGVAAAPSPQVRSTSVAAAGTAAPPPSAQLKQRLLLQQILLGRRNVGPAGSSTSGRSAKLWGARSLA
jgi:hypothetical protein